MNKAETEMEHTYKINNIHANWMLVTYGPGKKLIKYVNINAYRCIDRISLEDRSEIAKKGEIIVPRLIPFIVLEDGENSLYLRYSDFEERDKDFDSLFDFFKSGRGIHLSCDDVCPYKFLGYTLNV